MGGRREGKCINDCRLAPLASPPSLRPCAAPVGIGGLSQLTALELHAGAGLPAGAVAGIAAQLTRLHRLRLARLGSQAWAELPLLTALRQLSSLGLEVEGVKPVVSFSVGLSTVLPLLPSGGGTLRRLELVCFDGSVEAPPLAPLAGLEALDIAVPLQASHCQQHLALRAR